jgi:spore germination protein YaaH
MRRIGAIAGLLVAASANLVSTTGNGDERPSVHRSELARHQQLEAPPSSLPGELPAPRSTPLARAVYGYYPYWAADLTTIRWSALTHVAWFAIELDSEGAIVAAHGWPDEDLVAVARAAGVRVDVTFTLFGASAIEALCTSAPRRAVAVDTMVSALEAGDADGISVDFEFVNAATRDDFVAFIQELRSELDSRGHAAAEISIAGPAIDWGDALDMEPLLDLADWFFVMGYGYFWGGSSHAGPTGMLRVTPDWAPYQNYSMVRTIADYSRRIRPEQRRRMLWGVPYYGREWLTDGDALGAAAIDDAGSVTYTQAVNDLTGGAERLWDDGVKNPWYRWHDGADWHQVHYDDAESLAAKYAVALDQDLGGVGMWALNYDKPHAELWDLLEATFDAPPVPADGHRERPIAITTWPFHDERNTADGPSHYFNYYGCDPETPEFGREWVYSIDVCQTGTLLARVPNFADQDPDLHLLSAPDQDACLARAHTELEAALTPGRYLLVVDTYVDMPVELEGPYELDVDFSPDAGSEGCAPHLVCDAGSCRCPAAEALDCGDGCVDAASDPRHCGACGHACSTGQACRAGRCEGDQDADPPSSAPPDEMVSPLSASLPASCACAMRATAPRDDLAFMCSILAALATIGLRRSLRVAGQREGRAPRAVDL